MFYIEKYLTLCYNSFKKGGDGMSDENAKSENKKDGWLIVLFSAIGSVIAALSFSSFLQGKQHLRDRRNLHT